MNKSNKLLKKTKERKKFSVAQKILLSFNQPTVDELADRTVQDFATKSGKSVEKVKLLFADIEKGVAKNIDKEKDPSKFFAVVTAQVKKSLGIQ